jgi:hypothetical protein
MKEKNIAKLLMQRILITVSVGSNLRFHFCKDWVLTVKNYQNQRQLNKRSKMFANALRAGNKT